MLREVTTTCHTHTQTHTDTSASVSLVHPHVSLLTLQLSFYSDLDLVHNLQMYVCILSFNTYLLPYRVFELILFSFKMTFLEVLFKKQLGSAVLIKCCANRSKLCILGCFQLWINTHLVSLYVRLAQTTVSFIVMMRYVTQCD